LKRRGENEKMKAEKCLDAIIFTTTLIRDGGDGESERGRERESKVIK
jgi:hypothetical protein